MPEEKNKTVNTSDISQDVNQKESKIKRGSVRTYRDFAVSALRDKPTSLAKMVIEEKKKEEFEYNTSAKNPKNFMMVILSSVLVFLGVVSIAAVVIFINNRHQDVVEKEKAINPESIIYFDYKKEVDVTGYKRRDIIRDTSVFIKDTNIPIKDVKIFYFIEKGENGYKKLLSAKDFIVKMETRAPTQFIRNLGDRFTYGVYSHIESNKPFLILEFLDVDSVYTNILSWEKMIVSDIGALFEVDKTYYSQQFSDLNLHNKDARVILNEQGEIVFGYSFIDLNHVVFFTDADEFGGLVALFQNFKEK